MQNVTFKNLNTNKQHEMLMDNDYLAYFSSLSHIEIISTEDLGGK